MPEIHTLYHHATDLRVDSISRDRWHEVFTRGDTVFVHDSIDRWHYIFSGTTDTIRQHDSIPYPVYIPSPSPRGEGVRGMRLRFYRSCTLGFFLLLIALIAFIALRLYLRKSP